MTPINPIEGLQRISIKFFAQDSTSIYIRDFVPPFHSWIQNKTIQDHLLIDVADYGHIYHGPGIVLVAHEANFSMDQSSGRLGLLYQRKTPLEGVLQKRVNYIIKATLQACHLLETDKRLEGKIKFKKDELLLIANDRLFSPNTEDSFESLKGILTEGLPELFGEGDYLFTRVSEPQERLSINIQLPKEVDITSLSARVSDGQAESKALIEDNNQPKTFLEVST